MHYRVAVTSGRGGEQGPPGSLAVAVGQLGPVLQGQDPGGDGAALHFTLACGHACFCCSAATVKVLKLGGFSSNQTGAWTRTKRLSSPSLLRLSSGSVEGNGEGNKACKASSHGLDLDQVRVLQWLWSGAVCCICSLFTGPSSHSWCLCATATQHVGQDEHGTLVLFLGAMCAGGDNVDSAISWKNKLSPGKNK